MCDVAAERGNAFDEVAASYHARGRDREAPIRDTLKRWIERVAGEPLADIGAIAEELEQFELEHERLASRTNAVALDWISRERARGRRIVFCSDMYLGSALIFRLLESGRCAHLFDAGYVSSDIALTKVSGRLFGHLLRSERIEPAQVVHIGDSMEADGYGAALADIRGVVVHDGERHRRFAAALSDRIDYHESPDWAGVVIAAYAESEVPPSTVEEAVGRCVVGPAVAAAAHSVAEQCRARRVRHVYFLAREGFLLKAAFDRLTPQVWPDRSAPRSSYACLSRQTTLLAATRGLGAFELSATLTNHSYATLRRLLAPFGVPAEVILQCGARYGIVGIDVELPAWFRDWPPFLRLLDCAEVKEYVERTAREAHDALAGYLTQEGFFDGGRVAIVDVGWGGLMQENLHRAFGCRPGFPEIVGFYVGIDDYGRERRSADRQLVSVLGESRMSSWQGSATLLFPAGFETLLRAPHGTTIGYDGTTRTAVVPRLCEDRLRSSEQADEPRLAVVHRAALEYVQRYAECSRMLNISSGQTVPFARTCLDRFMRYPTAAEARFLFSLSSVSDLGTRETRLLGDDASRLARLRRLSSLRGLVRASLWRHGTVALAAPALVRHALVAWWAANAPLDAPAERGDGLAGPPAEDTRVTDTVEQRSDCAGRSCIERAAWERTAALADAVDRGSSLSSRTGLYGLGLGYLIWSPVTRRVVNLWRGSHDWPTFVSDGVSHARLLRRSCVHSKAGRRLLDVAIRLYVRAAHRVRRSTP